MDDLVVAYSGNLSRGGLFLKSEELLPVGTIVQITLELPDDGPEIAVACTVVFTRDTGLRGMGVKFNDPDEQTKARVEQFIIGAAPEAHTSSLPPAERRVLDIVVVDDDPIQSKRAADAFRERGDTVRTARDGLEGLALCIKKAPDAVLTDVQMPKMDGWQLVRMLRARPAFANMPIVFLTTLANESDRLLGYRLGVDDYLPKPYEPSELVTRVDRIVLRSTQQQLQVAGAEKGRSLSGDLEQVGMPSILAFLEVERRSGELSVGPDVTGRIVIREGRPLRAEVSRQSETATGRQAFFALLDVARGRFDFHESELEGPDEIGAGISALLLEHARLRDEQPAP
jgi:DNA-binding response OmpR family regulator/Tfp pilus assembly protein PilZ